MRPCASSAAYARRWGTSDGFRAQVEEADARVRWVATTHASTARAATTIPR